MIIAHYMDTKISVYIEHFVRLPRDYKDKSNIILNEISAHRKVALFGHFLVSWRRRFVFNVPRFIRVSQDDRFRFDVLDDFTI